MNKYWKLAIGLVVVLGCVGCAIAPRYDAAGNLIDFVVGTSMSGSGASAKDIGRTVGQVAGAFGIPGGEYIGTLAGGVLATLGVGVGAYQKGKRTGDSEGYEYAKAEYTEPPPRTIKRKKA